MMYMNDLINNAAKMHRECTVENIRTFTGSVIEFEYFALLNMMSISPSLGLTK